MCWPILFKSLDILGSVSVGKEKKIFRQGLPETTEPKLLKWTEANLLKPWKKKKGLDKLKAEQFIKDTEVKAVETKGKETS